MSKPEDIPQRIWDIAYEASFTGKLPVVASVARAILAAEQREREACAQVAADHGKERATGSYSRPFRRAAELIEAAIRNRGEHHD